MSRICECGQPLKSDNANLYRQHKRSIFHRNHKRIKALLANDCMTYQAIGERLGVTRERVRQIHKLIDPSYTANNHRGNVCTVERHNQSVQDSVPNNSLLASLKEICEKEGLSFEPVGAIDSGKYRAHKQLVIINSHLCFVGFTSLISHANNVYYQIRCSFVGYSFRVQFLKDDGIWLILPSGVPKAIYILLERNKKRRFETLSKKYDWTQYFNAWHLLREPKC